MTEFQYFSLTVGLFTALGTCGATIVALYFGLNVNRIKLKFRALHGDTFGSLKPIDNGYFVVTLTNTSNWPITLETVGLKSYSRKWWFFKKMDAFMMFQNTLFDTLPIKLEYGQSYTYAVPMTDMQNRIREFQTTHAIYDVRVFACVSTAPREVEFKLKSTLKSSLIENNQP